MKMNKLFLSTILSLSVSTGLFCQNQQDSISSGTNVYPEDIMPLADTGFNGSILVDGDVLVGTMVTGKMGEGKRLYFRGVDPAYDDVHMVRFNRENDKTDLRVRIGEENSDDDRFCIGYLSRADKLWYNKFVVTTSGKVGIGTETPKNALDVKGTIRAEKVTIEAPGWADFVFEKNYQLPSLESVEQHIADHKHLPGIPSEKEVMDQGVNIGEMQSKLLQKIEELTLYVIQQDKRIQQLQEQLEKK